MRYFRKSVDLFTSTAPNEVFKLLVITGRHKTYKYINIKTEMVTEIENPLEPWDLI